MSGEPNTSDNERVIFHVDLDAFYVEAERQNDPSLIGKPVVIGGIGPRGVVATASYEARKFGVHSAMATAVARRLCPQAIYMRGNHDLYRTVSKKFMSILREYSPNVVPVSVDEAYLDMTGTERLYGEPIDTADQIRKAVRDELGLPASIGIGPSKLIAKVSTEHAKPDGVFQVRLQEAESFFAPQPVRNLPGIGPKAGEALAKLEISTLGQLAAAPVGPLRRALGPNHADYVQRRARGIDNAPLKERVKAKSISAETTFETDVSRRSELEKVLKKLSERVGTRLRKSGLRARGASIKLRYGDFSTITRQRTFAAPGDGDQLIYDTAHALLVTAMRQRGDAIRLLGVSVTGLGEQAAQLSLLDQNPMTDSDTSEALDAIRERFGSESISRGSV
ncbi:MAG: DNA polymerase IV [Chloroflexi bacterium]|jgi:DNA polymerase IV|nr:DNA polymerase IV [Chloroflexota bacterium]